MRGGEWKLAARCGVAFLLGGCARSCAPRTNPQPATAADLALVTAATSADLVAIDTALADGASVAYADVDGRSALAIAAARGHADVVTRLLEAGAGSNRAVASQALTVASGAGREEVVTLLLAAGVDINGRAATSRSCASFLKRVRADRSPIPWVGCQSTTLATMPILKSCASWSPRRSATVVVPLVA